MVVYVLFFVISEILVVFFELMICSRGVRFGGIIFFEIVILILWEGSWDQVSYFLVFIGVYIKILQFLF